MWEANAEKPLIDLAERLKKVLEKGTPGKMKKILLDCIPREFTSASEYVKQYANNFEEKHTMMRAVEDAYIEN